MKCSRCQAENDEGARFCEDCGARLEVSCPSCGAPVTAGKKFCRSCGAALTTESGRFASPESYTPKHLAEKILISRTVLEGERKQVTVLFADLKGSMELLADRDPEEARKLIDPVLAHMMEAVHRYEGTVNQVMGDGIMALFGAPLGHEDHAVRACYAALRIQESVKRYADGVRLREGFLVQVRVGLNSGEVVVRSIGSDLRMDYTAVGQTTHLAARMEQLAAPGTVLVSQETLRLAEDYVQVNPLGPVHVKGLDGPVEVHELIGVRPARTRLQAAATRGLTRFVGRELEMDQLHRALARAREGDGQLVAVVGEPGVGKSRLFYELTRSHRVDSWLVLETGAVSYGKATPYLPVIDLLKTYAHVEPRDDPRRIREKLTGKLLTLDREFEPLLPAFMSLLDVLPPEDDWHALDPPQRRLRTLGAVKRLLLRESQIQPLVLVFENLHWVDSETQALLDGLVDSLPTARLIVLVNYRPEYQHGWGAKTYYAQLRVDPLAPESAGELLDGLLGGGADLSSLKRLLIERTEGNPFFLEESVQALIETGALVGGRGAYRLARQVAALRVPATVQAVLAARIDRLSSDDKRLLQAAAVVGKDVPLAWLREIVEDDEEGIRRTLERLQHGEFLYEASLVPELVYTFKHALTQEVAYAGLLHERRRELHARVVNAIERLYPDRLAEQIERLAHHALRGELREKAVDYLRRAGFKALGRSALPDAVVWLEHALGMLRTMPETQADLEQAIDIRLELQVVLSRSTENLRALAFLREAEELAERLKDDRRRGRVFAATANVLVLSGELDEALPYGIRALALARALGDLELLGLATTFLERVHYYRGDYMRAIELATDNPAVPWIGEGNVSRAAVGVASRTFLVLSLAELGRFAEAAQHEAEVIRLAEATQDPYNIWLAYFAAAVIHPLKGDWRTARSLNEHAIAALRSGNIILGRGTAFACSAWVLAQLGETGEASTWVQESQQVLGPYAARGIAGSSGWAYHSLGQACLLLGRLDEARRLGDFVVESAPVYRGFVAHALHLLGDVATHPDRFDAETGEVYYRRALALAEPRGMRPLVAHCHFGMSKLYRRLDEKQQAQERLSMAATMYREMDMKYWLAQAEAARGA